MSAPVMREREPGTISDERFVRREVPRLNDEGKR